MYSEENHYSYMLTQTLIIFAFEKNYRSKVNNSNYLNYLLQSIHNNFTQLVLY